MRASPLLHALGVAGALVLLTPSDACAQTAHVKIRSKTTNVVVYQWADGMWIPACKWPCDQKLLLGERYKVSANGKLSEELTLDARPNDQLVLDVRHRNGWLTALGVVLTIGAAVPISYATFVDDNDAQAGTRIALGAFGAGLAIIGVLIAVHAKDVRVEQSSAPRLDAWMRAPRWRTEQRCDSTALMSANTLTFPLFNRAF